MKKLYSFIILFSGFFTASAQTYIPFPSSNAIWTQRQGKGDADPSFSVYGMKTDDTIINGLTYHKLYHSSDAVLDASEYCGGIREDANKRVYFYDAASNKERMLYDFSVVAGDTVNDGLVNHPVIVDHIDSVNISGIYHKRINFRQIQSTTGWPMGAWVEGIGNSSLGGLLGAATAQPTCDCAANTVCFTSGNITYHNPVYASLDCFSILNTEVLHNAPTTVTLFPNPMAGTGTLRITGQALFNTLTVCDMQGRQVLLTDVTGKNEVSLNGNGYAAGVYFYRLLRDNGEGITGKFIVY